MDRRCRMIYHINNFDLYKPYVNYYVDSIKHRRPYNSIKYFIYLASSITILRKYVTSRLPYISRFKFDPLKKGIPKPVIGTKFIVEEREDTDVK